MLFADENGPGSARLKGGFTGTGALLAGGGRPYWSSMMSPSGVEEESPTCRLGN